jgi:glucosamine kinase
MAADSLFLAVDGGGTVCRARLCDASGRRLGEAEAGPANIRFGLEEAFASVLDATFHCLAQAQLTPNDLPRITACLALAGATEPAEMAAAKLQRQGFGHAILTADAHAACVGAHDGGDGGIIVVGTGSIGWAVLNGRQHRVGGWGLPVSDEGSGAWIGREVLRRVLMAYDGRRAWTPLLRALFEVYDSDPHGIVQWTSQASPREFGTLAPLVVEYALRNDEAGLEILHEAAAHVDVIANRLIQLGAPRLSLVGGVAPHLERFLAASTQQRLVQPFGDPLYGAFLLARAAAQAPLADQRAAAGGGR